MNLEEARAAVHAELERKFVTWGRAPDAFVILDESTRETSWGWVFFYDSRRFAETGDERDAFGGNAPLLVNRTSGEIRSAGTARPIEFYIEAYEASLPHPT